MPLPSGRNHSCANIVFLFPFSLHEPLILLAASTKMNIVGNGSDERMICLGCDEAAPQPPSPSQVSLHVYLVCGKRIARTFPYGVLKFVKENFARGNGVFSVYSHIGSGSLGLFASEHHRKLHIGTWRLLVAVAYLLR